MPAKALDERSRQHVEGPDEDTVVERALPPAMKARLHREALGHDSDIRKSREQLPEFTDAELQQYRCIVVLEIDLHQFRQGIEPRDPVVHLNDREPARLQYAPAFVDEALRIGSVLHDAMGEHEIVGIIIEWQLLRVGNRELSVETLLRKVGSGKLNGRIRYIDAGDDGAAFGKPG